MKLSEWIDTQEGSRWDVYTVLSQHSGISVQTISSVDRGMRLKTYARAKALSEATEGAVTVAELCE